MSLQSNWHLYHNHYFYAMKMKYQGITITVVILSLFLTGVIVYNLIDTNSNNSQGIITNEDDIFPTSSSVPAISGNTSGLTILDVVDNPQTSIPLEEILSGGPQKDGIPSIDNPQFVPISEVDFLEDTSLGLGLEYKEEQRFYPFQVLVWHEIVNDVVAGDPLLITYCPLCATAIVFDRNVDGEVLEFGVSGRLWLSNLLMYDRRPTPEEESLWSQILGEAVVGQSTGAVLDIVDSNSITFGDWKDQFPDSVVLSQETGFDRTYGVDPYGDYYVNDTVSFGASFDDDRLHPKEIVAGISINGQYKAYNLNDLEAGEITDEFAGETITVTKDEINRVSFSYREGTIDSAISFWFSWLAVHPETELYAL